MIRVLLALLVAAPAATQRPGVEVLAYPAGIQGGIRVEAATRFGAVEGLVGANLTDRRDWGVHRSESGWGLGAGLGVRWASSAGGVWFGARADLWALTIDWADLPSDPEGTTSVLVVQPTLRGGWRFSGRRLTLDLMAAFGREINARTRGEPVGEGWIGLAGVTLSGGR